jgi:hypothetical protein
MAASAFTRFDPGAFLKNVSREGTAAKAAKPAKVPPERKPTFATFATFAEAAPRNRDVDPPADTWTDAQDERAAIIEHDGGAPHEWAEALARLDVATPPCDISPKRWLRFIDDCGRFLDEGWAERAEALGWGPLDLFGCDRIRPFARIDRAGLLWFLNGQKLLALADNAAAIATSSGGSLTFRRSPNEPGRVLAWELEL